MTDMIAPPGGSIIAVVDDDQRVLESLGSLLDSADHSVHLFDSAAAMLDSGCLAGITCLISDIDMPVMDGFELLGIVKAQRPDLAVILITGQSSKVNQNRSVDQGGYRLLKKPFSAHDLLSLIGAASQGAAPLAPPP
jgi:FixJ family two-component response regulator